MKLTFHSTGWDDYLHWQVQDRRVLKKINGLIKECLRTPFTGTGKPEPLRGELSGWWSRRIDQEHRLIYRMTDGGLEIAQCRYHYSD
ncbi:Txe/YoeB family addiction module toxin [Brevundimonas sp.]|uniref:Txe/YoeB family addiction module toxin n=1 Tax=Brevundimonas sp. TaxID=1871086 RepID=UPI002AB99821|nr:Txe/YoeB family addiction module toxin [Brevundimonas sp.]MDZ4364906.1 Txe/YoeB family addiction module toxin [Brevundimonas sp.]